MSALEPRGVRSAMRSDVGRVRSSNQDDCAEFEGPSGARLLVVADGMGGHAAGEVASREAVRALGEVFRKGEAGPEALLREAFGEANRRVHRLGEEYREQGGMGTTAVALALFPDGAWLAHVGDSRAYRWRDGDLERLTQDHSWVQHEVRQRHMTEAEARVHPRRHALLRSVGVEPEVEVDVRAVDVAPGDRLLLCSDGVWDELDDRALAEVLATPDPRQCVDTLIELALLAGGHDNATACVAFAPARTPRRGHLRRLAGSALLAGLGVLALAWWRCA